MHQHRTSRIFLIVLAACFAWPLLVQAQQDFGSAPVAPAPPSQPSQQPYPSSQQQPAYPAPESGAYGQAPAAPNGLSQLMQHELQDFGVPPQDMLQQTLHGPTPTSIPGGQVITTDRVVPLLQQAAQNGVIVLHVLGDGPRLPNAQNAGPASQAGSFDDQTQREFGQYLQQVTQGSKARPLLFYCQNPQCWMSYNAALRAIHMGFSNVLWYRGGIEAWQQVQAMSAAPQQQQFPQQSGY